MLPQSRNTTVRSRDVRRAAMDQAVQREEAVLVGQRQVRRRDEHPRVLAERAQHALHAHQRAERVAVGVLVRGEHEARVLADVREHPLARDLRARDARAHSARPRSPRSAHRRAAPGRSCRRRRTRASACASGAARRRPAPCRKPCALRRPSSVVLALRGLRGSAGSPSTLTYTRAWRRSAAGSDIGHGHKSHSRVLQISCHQRRRAPAGSPHRRDAYVPGSSYPSNSPRIVHHRLHKKSLVTRAGSGQRRSSCCRRRSEVCSYVSKDAASRRPSLLSSARAPAGASRRSRARRPHADPGSSRARCRTRSRWRPRARRR